MLELTFWDCLAFQFFANFNDEVERKTNHFKSTWKLKCMNTCVYLHEKAHSPLQHKKEGNKIAHVSHKEIVFRQGNI